MKNILPGLKFVSLLALSATWLNTANAAPAASTGAASTGAASTAAASTAATTPTAATPAASASGDSASAPVANLSKGDPYQVVQQTTEQVLAIIKDAKEGDYDKDPQRFNKRVTEVMEQVVDFESFTRGVMGTYASDQRYKALKTEAEKAAFRERIQRFSTTFKQGLVDTYAKGLLKFNGQKIETLPPRKGDDPKSGTVAVVQNIASGASSPYVVQYSMRRNKEGQWKLHNVIIEGINMGQTYRSQFAAAADQHKGDLEKVIANWRVEPDTAIPAKSDANK